MVDPQADLDISIVIPVYNEEENIEPLLEEIRGVMEGLEPPRSWEVICVDDCSTDRSPEILRRLRETRPFLVTARHRVNCGESAAEATGFRTARGKVIITIDGDRQNDPADIPRFLEHLTPEVHCVTGVRRKREDDWVKRISSRIANRFRNAVTGDAIADAGCTYRAIRREALREVPVFNGMHRFIPTLLRLQGYTVKELSVNHRPRTAGVSKYGVGNRLWRGIRDCLAMRWYRCRALPGDRIERVEGRDTCGPAPS